MPPSPRLSACKMNVQYLIEITTISDQRIRERSPKIVAGDRSPRPAACAASLRA